MERCRAWGRDILGPDMVQVHANDSGSIVKYHLHVKEFSRSCNVIRSSVQQDICSCSARVLFVSSPVSLCQLTSNAYLDWQIKCHVLYKVISGVFQFNWNNFLKIFWLLVYVCLRQLVLSLFLARTLAFYQNIANLWPRHCHGTWPKILIHGWGLLQYLKQKFSLTVWVWSPLFSICWIGQLN